MADDGRSAIFVSYRRGDSAGHTGRLVDHLEHHFGQRAVFHDVQSIDAGRRWDEVIADGVSCCRVMVAVIGRNWLGTQDDQGRRRLEDPQDPLRREIASALARGIPIVPVLVNGAAMPAESALPEDLRPLARWQAHELSDTRWDFDIGRLVTMLERTTGLGATIPPDATAGAQPSRKRPALVAAGFGLVAVAAVVLWLVPGTGTPPVAVPPAQPAPQPIPAAPEAQRGPSPPSVPQPVPASPAQPRPGPSSQAPAAPASVAGHWHDESANVWGIEQKGAKVALTHTASGSGTLIGYGEGTLTGRIISFEYTVAVPDEPRLAGRLALSEDGRKLTGSLNDPKQGGNTHVVLHRQE